MGLVPGGPAMIGNQETPNVIRVVLPWPPTANTSKGRRKKGAKGKGYYKTEDLKIFQEKAGWILKSLHLRPLEPPYRLTIWFREKNYHGGDLANFEKHVTDALVAARLIKDDRYINDYRFLRAKRLKEGRVCLQIESLPNDDPAHLPIWGWDE